MSDEPKIADELRQMEAEPLLPIEKKLVAFSLIIGAALLGILLWISHAFFPGGDFESAAGQTPVPAASAR